MSIADRFKLARDAGFEQIECPTTPDEHEAEEDQEGCRERPGCAFTP